MRYLDAQDAACLCVSCTLMKGALVDFNCQEMHSIWWLLCKVLGIMWRYELTKMRHTAAYERYEDECPGLELEEQYDGYLRLEFAYMQDLVRLFQEYEQIVGQIPVRIAEKIWAVHDCGMVFQVLLDYEEEDVVADFNAGRRPFFFRVLRDRVSFQLSVRTKQLFGTGRLWLQM